MIDSSPWDEEPMSEDERDGDDEVQIEVDEGAVEDDEEVRDESDDEGANPGLDLDDADLEEDDGEFGTLEWAMIDPRLGGGTVRDGKGRGDITDTHSFILQDVIGVDETGRQEIFFRFELPEVLQVGRWTRITGESPEPSGLDDGFDLVPNEELAELARLRASYPGFEEIVANLGRDGVRFFEYRMAQDVIIEWNNHRTDDPDEELRRFVWVIRELRGRVEDWGRVEERFEELFGKALAEEFRAILPAGLDGEEKRALFLEHWDELREGAARRLVEGERDPLVALMLDTKVEEGEDQRKKQEGDFLYGWMPRGLKRYLDAVATLTGIEVDGDRWRYDTIVAVIDYREE